MKISPWAMLRDARYALPRLVEKVTRGPGPDAAARICRKYNREGLAVTTGYFQAENAAPEDIVSANMRMIGRLKQRTGDASLSVKAPPLGFDSTRLTMLARAAADAGLALAFDAHAPPDTDPTLDAVWNLLPAFPGTGCVLPARWQRSLSDAVRFRDSTAPIRIVKGEWADVNGDQPDIEASYLALASRLAGRSAPVGIATHDPLLAERALKILLEAGTPCELQQLRGLPRRRTVSVASNLGVTVRIYVPFGPGWWPYALDKALARPYLASWMIKDLLGGKPERTAPDSPFSISS